MANIITREIGPTAKGSPLTNTEVDNNFINLNTELANILALLAESASVVVSDTAPSSPSNGDLWWKSDEGTLKVYYQDINSSQWVDASPVAKSSGVVSAGVSTFPTNPVFARTNGVLTSIAYGSGEFKVFTWTDGVLTQLDFIKGSVTVRKTFNYTNEVLTSITQVTL